MLREKLISAQSSGGTFKGFIGISSSVAMYSFCVDSGADVHIIGGYENTSPQTGFIVCIDKSGSVKWQRKITKPGVLSNVFCVKIDSSANVYVFAKIGNGLSLLKYNYTGTLQWQRNITFSSNLLLGISNSNRLQVTSDGYLYLLVAISGTYQEAAILKYNSSGVLQWQKKYSMASVSVAARDMVIDSSGNIYVNMGYGPTSNSNCQLKKLNSSGTELAGVQVSSISSASSLAFHGGYIYISNGPLVGSTEVEKLDTSLSRQSALSLGAVSYSIASMAADSVGIFAITSSYNNYFTFSSTPSILTQRLVDSTVGTGEALYGVTLNSTSLIAAGGAYLNSATIYSAMLMCVDRVNDIGAYPPLSISDVSTSSSTPSNRIGAPITLTLGNSSLVDSPGDIVDSAATYTITKYLKS